MVSRLALGRVVTMREIEEITEAAGVSDNLRSPGLSLWEGWAQRLSDVVREAVEGSAENSLSILDLSGMEAAVPRELAGAVRQGLRSCIPEDRVPLVPARAGGRRYFALRWKSREQSAGRYLRDAFRAAWEMADRDDEEGRLLIPWITETGTGILGNLPPSLGGSRLRRVVARRVMTYHALRRSGYATSPKSLGREARRLARLGLLVPREYATDEDLEALGVRGPRVSRPRLWESLAAAARELSH